MYTTALLTLCHFAGEQLHEIGIRRDDDAILSLFLSFVGDDNSVAVRLDDRMPSSTGGKKDELLRDVSRVDFQHQRIDLQELEEHRSKVSSREIFIGNII